VITEESNQGLTRYPRSPVWRDDRAQFAEQIELGLFTLRRWEKCACSLLAQDAATILADRTLSELANDFGVVSEIGGSLPSWYVTRSGPGTSRTIDLRLRA
jgi:hypothetical protein